MTTRQEQQLSALAYIDSIKAKIATATRAPRETSRGDEAAVPPRVPPEPCECGDHRWCGRGPVREVTDPDGRRRALTDDERGQAEAAYQRWLREQPARQRVKKARARALKGRS